MSAQEIMEQLAPAQETAAKLTDQLLEEFLIYRQAPLFDTRDPHEIWKDKTVEDIQAKNIDKVVLPGSLVDKYRIMSAFLGAGFHPSQYEDVMIQRNDPLEVGRLVIGMMFGERGRVKPYTTKSNRMTDEVTQNEMFTTHVPTTRYDVSTKHYITSPHDLCTIFIFDYKNLQTCRELGFDLLYERED